MKVLGWWLLIIALTTTGIAAHTAYVYRSAVGVLLTVCGGFMVYLAWLTVTLAGK